LPRCVVSGPHRIRGDHGRVHQGAILEHPEEIVRTIVPLPVKVTNLEPPRSRSRGSSKSELVGLPVAPVLTCLHTQRIGWEVAMSKPYIHPTKDAKTLGSAARPIHAMIYFKLGGLVLFLLVFERHEFDHEAHLVIWFLLFSKKKLQSSNAFGHPWFPHNSNAFQLCLARAQDLKKHFGCMYGLDIAT
jgi:hypothetical protein